MTALSLFVRSPSYPTHPPHCWREIPLSPLFPEWSDRSRRLLRWSVHSQPPDKWPHSLPAPPASPDNGRPPPRSRSWPFPAGKRRACPHTPQIHTGRCSDTGSNNPPHSWIPHTCWAEGTWPWPPLPARSPDASSPARCRRTAAPSTSPRPASPPARRRLRCAAPISGQQKKLKFLPEIPVVYSGTHPPSYSRWTNGRTACCHPRQSPYMPTGSHSPCCHWWR